MLKKLEFWSILLPLSTQRNIAFSKEFHLFIKKKKETKTFCASKDIIKKVRRQRMGEIHVSDRELYLEYIRNSYNSSIIKRQPK